MAMKKKNKEKIRNSAGVSGFIYNAGEILEEKIVNTLERTTCPMP